MIGDDDVAVDVAVGSAADIDGAETFFFLRRLRLGTIDGENTVNGDKYSETMHSPRAHGGD